MKKLFLAGLCLLGFASVKAAPGDTTWVQAHDVRLDYYNNFDTAVTFPSAGTTYRRIYMIFTLGKYDCGSATYCGDWDYTVQNFLLTPGGDTMELARLITPYAGTTAPRTPMTWKQRYVFDVTDYASKLTGPATMRILYSGYSGGFTANVKFAFIEGTPDRNVVDIKKLWAGSFNYGNASNPINTHFPAASETAPAGTDNAVLKFTVTGHGSDGTGCSEFCSKNYDVLVNGSVAATKTIWRDNCGVNELWPQSGTWIFDRGNWCPGALVIPHYVKLPSITAGSSFTTAVQFQDYTVTGSGTPSYTTEGHLIYYGAMNKSTDATLEYIVSPTNDENHFRENPTCGTPVIHVKNTGASAITSLRIAYGIQDSVVNYYDWTGTLASLDETDITLPSITGLNYLVGTTGIYTFKAEIQQVNGAADMDATNNILTSQFVAAPKWPSAFKVVMRTNNAATTTGGSVSETDWRIYDMTGTVVASRVNNDLSKLYTDTVRLAPGCYKLEITDGSCDGLNFWYHGAAGTGVTSGYLFVRKLTTATTNIPMNGYTYSGTFANDFGCKFTQYFYSSDWNVGITEVNGDAASLEVYPNPAQNELNVEVAGWTGKKATIQLIDALGRVVLTQECTSQSCKINTSSLSNGAYTLQFVDGELSGSKLISRFVIAK